MKKIKCPKCKIETEVIGSSTRTQNGCSILTREVVCPKCGQKGTFEEVIGKAKGTKTNA